MRADADLLETPLEDLRTLIAAWLQEAEKPDRTAAGSRRRPGDSPQPLSDLRPARRRRDRCRGPTSCSQDFEVIHPVFDGDEAEVREYHEENLRNCDGVVIFYGAANEPGCAASCASAEERRLRPHQATQPVVRICLIAPRTPEKERFRTHEAMLVPQWDGCAGGAAAVHRRAEARGARAVAGDATRHLQPNPFPGPPRRSSRRRPPLLRPRDRRSTICCGACGSHRFLSVVGTSGSGKSSLVRSGLIPSLHSGFMAKAGSSWRIAIMRPGEDPIGHLAAALDAPDVLGAGAASSRPPTGVAARSHAPPRHARPRRRRPPGAHLPPTTTCSSSSISSRSCSGSAAAAQVETVARRGGRVRQAAARGGAADGRRRSTSC